MSTMRDRDYDVIFIGGGTASLAALSEFLELNGNDRDLKIALIDKQDELGGECALNACVPTKTLLSAARYLNALHGKMTPYGIENLRYDFNFQTLMHTVDAVIHDGEYEFLKDGRVTRIKGDASFVSGHTLAVRTEEGTLTCSAKRIVIATGAVPVIPPIQGLAELGYLTYRDATHLSRLPKSMVIIGGGPVGVEFSQLFQTFGVQVTLLQKAERLLENEEPEISRAIQAVLEKQGVQVVLNCDIDQAACSLRQTEDCTLKCIRAKIYQNGKEEEHCFEAQDILLAVGMQPDLQGLNLDAAGIRYSEEGIEVDGFMTTTTPEVWAVGDVVGPYQFTHVADYQAVIAARAMCGRADRPVDYTGLGWAVFTEPTIARVGLGEAQAKALGKTVSVVLVKTDTVSRYRIESEKDGFLKLMIDTRTDEVLGGHFFCSGADDIAHLLMLAVRNRMRVPQVLDVIYVYPAKSQLLQKALERYVSEARRKSQAELAAAPAR